MALSDKEAAFYRAAKQAGFADDVIAKKIVDSRAAPTQPVKPSYMQQALAGVPGSAPAQPGAPSDPAVLGEMSANMTDPQRRRQLERGVSDAVTFGGAERLANWADPGFSSTAASDQAAAPEYRTAGQLAGAVVPGVGDVAAPALGALASGVTKGLAHVLPHVAGAAATGTAFHVGGHLGGYAMMGTGIPAKVSELTRSILARAQIEKWPDSRLAKALAAATRPAAKLGVAQGLAPSVRAPEPAKAASDPARAILDAPTGTPAATADDADAADAVDTAAAAGTQAHDDQ